MKLSIIIVHYNTSEDLDRCLESVQAYPPRCEYRVVVVDNASRDPRLAAVQRRHPECEWVMNTENIGYARGCNLGMTCVGAEFYLILNPDIVVQPGALDDLLAFAEQHPKAGLIGPQLLNDDGTVQDSCRRFYTFRTLLLRRTFLGRLFPNSGTVGRHLMRDFDHRSSRPVDWVLGGCLLARRSAIERVGLMDERFFLYFEDVDWCYRMWQAGHEVLYTSDAQFQHRHRRASAQGPRSRSFWLHLASLISFYEKWGMLVYLLKKWRRPLTVWLLWGLDMAALWTSFFVAYGIRAALGRLFAEPLFPVAEYSPLLWFTCLLVTVTFAATGRYRQDSRHGRFGLVAHLQRVVTVAVLLLASSYLGHQQAISRAVLLLMVPIFAVATALGEAALRAVRRRMERGYLSLERTLLVGPLAQLRAWFSRASDPRGFGIDPVGYVTDQNEPLGTALPPLAGGEVPYLGTWSAIPETVQRYRISQVVFWNPPGREATRQAVVAALLRRRVRLRWRVDDVWLLAAGARPEPFGGEASGVVDPGGGSMFAAIGRCSLAFVSGLTLAVIAFWPHIWLSLVRVPRGGAALAEVACDSAGGEAVTLPLAGDGYRRVLPLWWQWRLAWLLVRGEVELFGARLQPTGTGRTVGTPPQAAEFWRDNLRRPGLSGRWAQSTSAETPAAVWRTLFLDPGGVGWLPAPEAAEPPLTDPEVM